MCGIFGGVGVDSGSWVSSARASEILEKRGPDFCSEFVSSGTFFLRHSLLHLSGQSTVSESRQPVRIDDKQIIAFNGEIYNWKRLASFYDLTAKTDTELLVEMLKRFSLCKVLSEIEGMYAISLIELGSEGTFRVKLARDHSGMKPLFYRKTSNKSIVFGSTVPMLVRGDESVDKEALEYFLFRGWYFPGETAYREIRSVLPGEILSWDGGNINRVAIDFPSFSFNPCLSAEEVRCVFESELRSMIPPAGKSDMVIGFSGGNDSSAIASMTSSLVPSNRFHLANIYFEDESLARWDESDKALLVAQKMGQSVSLLSVSVDDLRVGFREYVNVFGMPFGGSMMPCFLSNHAKEMGVRVELNGAGGDEAFGNYLRTESRLSEVSSPAQGQGNVIGVIKRRCGFVEREREYLQLFSSTDVDGYALAFSYRLQVPQEFMWTLDHLGGLNSVETRYPFLSARVVDAVRSFQISRGIRRELSKSQNLRAETGFYEIFPEIEKWIAVNSKGNFGTPISRLLRDYSPGLDLLNEFGLLHLFDGRDSRLVGPVGERDYSLLFRLAQLEEFVA